MTASKGKCYSNSIVLSICIPTYNRAVCLSHCLDSIKHNFKIHTLPYEVCISDNCSVDNTKEIVRKYQDHIHIRYECQKSNVGRANNYIKAVHMAKGEFVWLLGDDDLLLPGALLKMLGFIEKYGDVDFFYVNSYCADRRDNLLLSQPLNPIAIAKKAPPFSPSKMDQELGFIDLINPKISPDFLGGMFMSVFRKSNWTSKAKILNENAVNDQRQFSHFDNTFPHVKIFSQAFSQSRAFVVSSPLTINLSGVREWAPMSPLVNIVRMNESLNEFRRNGLSVYKFMICKNHALKTFFPDYARIILRKKESGYEYIKPLSLLFSSLLYPNAWLSPFYFVKEVFKVRLQRIGRE